MANWDRPDDRARAAKRWSHIAGARARSRGRLCRVPPCRARHVRGRHGTCLCCGRRGCGRRGPCPQNARAADGHDLRVQGVPRPPARHRAPPPQRLRPAHRDGVCGIPDDGRAVHGGGARLWRRRQPRLRRRGLCLPPGGRDGDDGCGHDAGGALPSGRRAARLRPVRGLQAFPARRPAQHRRQQPRPARLR